MTYALALIALLLGSSAADARSVNYCKSTVTGRFIARAAATADRAHARCVPALPAPAPAWLVVQWIEGVCQVWHNDALPTPPYTIVATGASQLEAWSKLQSLYARQTCL